MLSYRLEAIRPIHFPIEVALEARSSYCLAWVSLQKQKALRCSINVKEERW